MMNYIKFDVKTKKSKQRHHRRLIEKELDREMIHRPNSKHSKWIVALSMLLSSATLTCGEEDFGNDVNSSTLEEVLEIAPTGPIEVGVFEKTTFTIHLSDRKGRPIVGAPITASFTDQAHNATLVPNRLTTDANGSGAVEFTAPITESSTEQVMFDIRFQSAGKEVYVPVIVDPSLVGISVDIAYDGYRDLASLEAILTEHEETHNAVSPKKVELEAATLPTAVTFPGLIQEKRYKIEVNAYNKDGNLRANGILEDIVPNRPPQTLKITDSRLGIIGAYAITTHLIPDHVLDWSIPTLLNDLIFLEAPATAILDSIEEELAESDLFAQESFKQERETQNLDEKLSDNLLERDIDYPGIVEGITREMEARLADITLRGSLEIALPEGDTFTLYHIIESVTFGPPDDLEALTDSLEADQQDTGKGTAQLGPCDTLIISPHLISLGLGDRIDFLFRELLKKNLNGTDAAVGFLNNVGCGGENADETILFLLSHLEEITLRPTIEMGCQRAVHTMLTKLEENTAVLNQTTSLMFEGSCSVVVPKAGNQIEMLSDGVLEVTWDEESDSREVMNASFEASLIQE
jgi:hypothetical protein